MKTGNVLCINIDRGSPDFRGDYKEGPNGFNANHVFDYAHFMVKENYQAIMTDDDCTDVAGNK